jgi:hypothetical protein
LGICPYETPIEAAGRLIFLSRKETAATGAHFGAPICPTGRLLFQMRQIG